MRTRLIWNERQLRELDESVVASMRSIATRVDARSISVAPNVVAWGQYLDDKFTGQQWGLLGTSAACQVVALLDPADDVYSRHPKLDQARPLLFTDRTKPDPLLKAQTRRGELDNIIRLASVAEALVLDRREAIPKAAWPQLAHQIAAARGTGAHWTSDSASPSPSPAAAPTVTQFTTAFVVHALRRYESDDELDDARRWLSSHLGDDGLRSRLDLVALIGLALLGRRGRSTDTEVQAGIRTCQDLIIAKRGRTRRVVVDRPIFIGYPVNERTDYAFLNPEVLAALFLMRSGNPVAGRRFVLRTVRATADHVKAGNGFATEFGDEATVEQLWTSRLLSEFHSWHQETHKRRSLRPRAFLTLPATVIALLFIAVVGVVVTIKSSAEAGAAAALIAGTLTALVVLFRDASS